MEAAVPRFPVKKQSTTCSFIKKEATVEVLSCECFEIINSNF